jgi:tripartite-type tricarboxylate transporter receptor subunit TctC
MINRRTFTASALAALAPSPLLAQTPGPVVKVGTLKMGSLTNVWVAKQAGFFERNGLNVELVEFRNGNEAIAAHQGGSVDILLTIPGTSMAARERGFDLVMLTQSETAKTQGPDSGAIIVRSDSPYKTVKDFIDAAKAKPGELKQSGGSVTSRDNVIRQTLQHATGTRWAFVSFQGGGERLAALLGGHVDMMVIEPQEAGEQIRAGKLRVLAQITDTRLPSYPNVPTLKEAGFDVKATPQIRAVVAPPGFPKEAIAYYEDLFGRLRQTASWKKYVQDYQLEDSFSNGTELGKTIIEIEKDMREQFVQAGIKVVR